MGSRYQPCQSGVWSVLHIVGILIRAGWNSAGALTEKRTKFLTGETGDNTQIPIRFDPVHNGFVQMASVIVMFQQFGLVGL